MTDKTNIGVDRLRRLEPLSALSEERLQELVSLSYVEPLSMGVSVFREGDVDNQTVYLLKGDVQLLSSDGTIDRTITSRADESRFPLDDSQPRHASCTALTNVEIVRIDNSVLDYMMMWDQLAESAAGPEVVAENSESAEAVSRPAAETASKTEAKPDLASQAKTAPQPSPKVHHAPVEPNSEAQAGAQVVAPEETTAGVSPRAVANTSKATTAAVAESEPTPEKPSITPSAAPPPMTTPVKPKRPGEWIRKMHHIMAFKNLPPANVKALLEKMERIPLEVGDTVVKQGETGDYYYVLVDGKAGVTRTVELATLNAGASFGEESLVSGTERNATVTMKTPGAVMRLSKNDFNELLREPMLNRISPEEARSQVLMGAVWLDVRHAREYQHGHFRGAISIPLHELRMRIDELDRNVHYICCCRTGTRSSAAAFILVQNGYNASVLTGGIQVMPQDLKKDPAFTSK